MRKGYKRVGDYNVIDDLSGTKIKRSQARLTWNNQLVHKKRWEPRHPLDFAPQTRSSPPPSITRPVPEPIYLEPGDVTVDDL